MTFTRVRAMIFIAVLFVTALVVVLTAINRDTQVLPPADRCAPGDIRANISVPERNQVTLNVFNGTNRVGLAEQIGGEFANRGFTVATMESSPGGELYDGVAVITFGPDALGASWLISAYFLADEAQMNFDRERHGAEVDVTLGGDFQQLATSTEVNQSIAQMGSPELYPGTCAA